MGSANAFVSGKSGPTAYNTAYMAHFVRPNFGFAETSYMLETLSVRFWRGKDDFY
jgi:hypothetical protein